MANGKWQMSSEKRSTIYCAGTEGDICLDMLLFPLVFKVTFSRLQCYVWFSDGCLMLFEVWLLQFLLSD